MASKVRMNDVGHARAMLDRDVTDILSLVGLLGHKSDIYWMFNIRLIDTVCFSQLASYYIASLHNACY